MIELTGAFWIVLTGVLAATSCALLGSFLVLRRMSLLGDALSHAVLPGIAIAFFFTESRGITPMFLGAAAFGLLTTFLVETFYRKWNVPEDASIGIVFTAFFAIGVVLISVYAGEVDLDQECVLYGEIAYTPWDVLLWDGQEYGPRPVWILGGVLVINALLIGLFYKELVAASFDPALAISVGINATVVHYMLMGAVSLTTVAAFESVGAILVVAMFIVPGAAAYLWTDRLRVMLAVAVAFGVASAAIGYYMASWWDSSIAGAMVVVLGGFFLVSILLAPRQGLISRAWQRLQLSLQVAEDHILLTMVRRGEEDQRSSWDRTALVAAAAVWRPLAQRGLQRMLKRGWLSLDGTQVKLAASGQQRGVDLLRSHRLWETYMNQLGLPEDHVHGPADAVEHFIDSELQQEIDVQVQREVDPQGKVIPPGS